MKKIFIIAATLFVFSSATSLFADETVKASVKKEAVEFVCDKTSKLSCEEQAKKITEEKK